MGAQTIMLDFFTMIHLKNYIKIILLKVMLINKH